MVVVGLFVDGVFEVGLVFDIVVIGLFLVILVKYNWLLISMVVYI